MYYLICLLILEMRIHTLQVTTSLLRIQAPPPDIVASAEVMDDFYVIAQYTHIVASINAAFF